MRRSFLKLSAAAWPGAVVLLCICTARSVTLADEAPMRDAEVPPRVTVSTADYTIPDVLMVRENGKTVSLAQDLNDGRAVLVNFIFTTCASICPLSSQTFSVFQEKLGAERAKVHLVSISIDPEQDTPERLREYAGRFSAGPNWHHYTGTLQASLAAQRAFGVYRGDKMGHTPVTLLRAVPGKPWRRIDGFVTPDDLMREYRAALKAE